MYMRDGLQPGGDGGIPGMLVERDPVALGGVQCAVIVSRGAGLW